MTKVEAIDIDATNNDDNNNREMLTTMETRKT